MNGQVHNRVLNFRADGALIDAAAKRAKARGMSLAELLRATLRTAVSSQTKGEAE